MALRDYPLSICKIDGALGGSGKTQAYVLERLNLGESVEDLTLWANKQLAEVGGRRITHWTMYKWIGMFRERAGKTPDGLRNGNRQQDHAAHSADGSVLAYPWLGQYRPSR